MKNKTNFKAPSRKVSTLVKLCEKDVLIDTILKEGKTEFIAFDMESGEIKSLTEIESGRDIFKPVVANHPLLQSGSVVFPSGITDYGNKEELFDEIVGFIYDYVDMPEEFVYISAYYVMLTYLYEKFTELPYLRVLGDYGSGKSRFLKVVGNICHNPIILGGGATPAAIFRLMDQYKGTLVIDEADFSKSGTTEQIIKIFNTGYQKGNPIVRVEGEDYQVSCFNPFGPKLIGGRNEFSDKATESRCLVHLMERNKRDDIPYSLDDDFFQRAQILRNKLLKFRHDYFEIVHLKTDFNLSGLESRLKQIILPILSIVDDKDMQEMIIEFLRNKQDNMKEERLNSLFGGILFAIKKLLDGSDMGRAFYFEILEELQSNDRETIGSARLGYMLKENGIKTIRKSAGKAVILEGNEQVLERLYKEYNIMSVSS